MSDETVEVDKLRVECETFLREWKNHLAEVMSSRQANLNATDNRPEDSFFTTTKLDSSLKKNTAYVKKLRSITESQRGQLVKEFGTLNLTKYVGEMTSALVEAKLKMSDVPTAMELCELAHRRYAEFAPSLLDQWKKVLPSRKDDVKTVANPTKLRVDLRFFAELISRGVLPEKESLHVLGGLLSFLINFDKEEHNNIAIIISFTRFCGCDYAGLSVPRKYRQVLESRSLEMPQKSSVFSPEKQKMVATLLNDYYGSLCRHVVKTLQELIRIERHNFKVLHTKGELHADQQKCRDDCEANFQKLHAHMGTLADLLDADLPVLPERKDLNDESLLDETGENMIVAGGPDKTAILGDSPWEDEDVRMFYTHLPELRAILPGILFRDSEKATLPLLEEKISLEEPETTEEKSTEETSESAAAAEGSSAAEMEGAEMMESSEVGAAGEIPEAEVPIEEEGESGTTEKLSGSDLKLLMEGFMAGLPSCSNRDMIDKAASDFVTNMNTKTNRKKLVKALFGVQRTRLDLLPFYSRLVAVLNPMMPDVGTELVQLLIQEFRHHVRKKEQVFIESKVKNVRFLGELVKFRICPKSEILHCLKMLLFNFRHHNIDMACNLLEVCGYFLYHSPESHHKTRVLLDQMMRKKQASHLDQRHEMMIDNAFYQCNPPLTSSIPRVQRPPMQEYIRKLLFKDLSRTTLEKVLRQMRKLNWTDKDVFVYAAKCLSQPWEVRYNCVHCLASLLAGLMWFREDLGFYVIENILEEIRLGMEVNHPILNQRRISCVRYLGEMYNYRCVDSTIIFNTLYSLITFGIGDGKTPSPIDPPEHLLRIRLACVLLETCGQYFDRGTSKKKLDCYLTYLQRYYWMKRSATGIWKPLEHPFPLETENILVDTIEELRPKLILFESLEQSEAGVKAIEEEYKEKVEAALKFVNTGDMSTAVDTGDEDRDERDLPPIDEGDEEENRLSNSQSQTRTGGGDTSQSHMVGGHSEDEFYGYHEEEVEDEEVHLNRSKTSVVSPEDEDFLSAFDKVMAESLQQRMQEAVKVPQSDFSVPVGIAKRKAKTRFADSDDVSEDNEGTAGSRSNPKEEQTVSFVLMTKGKGNKPNFKTLKVPLMSDLAVSLRDQEEKELEEREKVKRLTLEMSQRMEEEERVEERLRLEQSVHSSMFTAEPFGEAQRRERAAAAAKFQHPRGAPTSDQIFSNKWR